MKFKIQILILFSICLLKFSIAKEKTNKFVNLWDSEECKNETLQHCKDKSNRSNSEIINCLQQSPAVIKSLSNICQNYLWNYKLNYLNIDFFNFITHDDCKTELYQFSNCASLRENHKVICLIKHKSEVTNAICKSQLTEVATIVFSDVMVISQFLGKCSDNIKELKCGRLDSELNIFSNENFISRITSQGKTIECLIESLQRLSGDCRTQILRLGELQSEDFHLNPSLYYACREERDTICSSVDAGSSRIYNCLEKKQSSALMSANCRKALRYKHQLESQDYKIRKTFSDKCAKDIYGHLCIKSANKNQIANLTSVIMCLLKNDNNNQLQPTCRSELKAARSQMAQNIDMFPDIKHNCGHEIKTHCNQIVANTGDTVIHCLMRNSMPALELGFNKTCLVSLKDYLQTVDPTEDIQQLDPLISQVCTNELTTKCNPVNYIEPNDRYECLLALIDEDKDHKEIGESCKSHLLTLAHFVEQDYSLNHKLYKMCHEDAEKFCGGKGKRLEQSSSVVPQAVLHCLLRKWNHQYIRNEQPIISFKCSSELKTIMKIEASSVMLNFKVYTACSMDLVKTCKESDKMDCLQLNYNTLSDPCKLAISKFLSLDAEEYSLKKLIARSCSPMVKKFCKQQLVDKNKDYMECLAVHKLDKDMDSHCKIAIEHYQIIGLDNYKIDHKFARFCSKEIQQFCKRLLPDSIQKQDENEDEIENGVTKKTQISKADVVSCLSRVLTIGLLNKNNPFSSQCYEQFTFEFLQTTNSINFDPELIKICQVDIAKWCSKDPPENVLSCLHRYQDNLSEECVNLLVSRQQLGAFDSRFDVGIQRHCREMITTYCSKVHSHKVFRCLHTNMRIEGFDRNCKKRVHRRLERRLVDLRLNPELLDNCKDEIKVHCNVSNIEERISNMKSHDKFEVINCLRSVFVEHRKFLGSYCRRLVYDIVLDANSNIHLDPGLYDVCQSEIKQMCPESLMENNVEADGRVQDCLKHNLLNNKISNDRCNREVYRLLREGLADIHVDPQLYSSCRNEITRICHTERLGHGRKLSCLLWAIEDKNMITFLSTGCKSVLQERKEMWEFATKMEAPKNVKEVFRLVAESDSRYYLLCLFITVLGCMVFVGILCGRFTRQAKKVIRNRR